MKIIMYNLLHYQFFKKDIYIYIYIIYSISLRVIERREKTLVCSRVENTGETEIMHREKIVL